MLFLEKGTASHGPKRAKRLFIPLNSKAHFGGYQSGMRFGRDFVLAKRVRGIKAMKIVEKERPKAMDRTKRAMARYIRTEISEALAGG